VPTEISKRRAILSAVAAALLLVTGCGSPGPDLAGDVCTKADTCKALSGITAAQCKNVINMSLASMPGAARSDAETAYRACLGMADCDVFNACIVGVMNGTGGTGGTGGTAAGGTTGGTAAGGRGGSAAPGAGGDAAGGTGGGAAGDSAGGASGASGGRGGNNVGGATGGSIAGRGGNAGGGRGGASGGSTGTAGTTGTGGSAAGTTGTGGGSVALELMTSAQNAYWVPGTVTKVTSGTADLAIDKNTTYQHWDGFGGCFNEAGWDALSVLSTDQVASAMKLLFDPTAGAAFVFGRLPMGASDYATSWYTYDDTSSPDYTMASFSIARDRQKLIPYVKAALQVRSDVRLWASPWVVPGWMMSGSTMKSDDQTLNAHALYMARYVEEYAKEGLKIWAIHPQNEPGYARVHWTQSQFIGFMKNNLGPTLAQRNLTTEVWCGTMSKDPDDTNIAKATAMDSAALQYVKGFGVQWNLMAAVSTLAQKGPVMQTEHRCGNYNFDASYWDKGRYSSTMPQNDHLYGEESWQLIRDWIVAGVNSYSAWNMVLDTVGMSLDKWPQNALLTVDRTAKKLNITAAYYAFRHYSQYIAPGATRIAISGSTDALAFKNPDGSVIVQVYNKGSAAKTMIVGIGSALSQSLYQFSVPSHGWDTLRIPQ
jgi:glucosylceramidase